MPCIVCVIALESSREESTIPAMANQEMSLIQWNVVLYLNSKFTLWFCYSYNTTEKNVTWQEFKLQ